MKAIVRDEYGSPDVLRLEEIPTPKPVDDEVLRYMGASGRPAASFSFGSRST